MQWLDRRQQAGVFSLKVISPIILISLYCQVHGNSSAIASPISSRTSASGLTKDPHIVELADDLLHTKERIVHSDEKSRELLGHLYEVNRKIKTMSDKRSKLADEMLATRGDANTLARSIARLEYQINHQKKLLSQRLRTIYKMGEQGTLQAIFSAQTSFELDRNIAFLQRIAHRDYELIQDFESNVKDLEKQRSKLKRNIRRLVSVEHRLKDQESSLEKEQQSKSQLLSQLRDARQKFLVKIKGLRKKADSFAQNRNSIYLFEESFFERKGSLPQPTNGYISQGYGLDQDDQYKFKLSHKGIFLQSAPGLPVRSIFKGKVQFVGPIDGYGKTVIIDHGDRYYTVYSHNRSLKVKKDQEIAEEEVIGETGKQVSGLSGIYFEIRHFSDSLDPQHWIKWNSNIEKIRQ